MRRGKLRAVKPKGDVLRFQYNPESVIETGGHAIYNDQPRPKRKTAQEFAGVSPRRISFPLFLDGFPDESIEDRIRILNGFAKPRAARRPGPELEFDYGPAGRGARWIIRDGDLTPGPELRDRRLRVTQQEFQVTLTEYIEADVTLTPAKRHRDKKKDKDKNGNGGRDSETRIYVVKRGDTLAKIAARFLGDADEWPRIARLNNIRDPDFIRVGQRLKIPRA